MHITLNVSFERIECVTTDRQGIECNKLWDSIFGSGTDFNDSEADCVKLWSIFVECVEGNWIMTLSFCFNDEDCDDCGTEFESNQ